MQIPALEPGLAIAVELEISDVQNLKKFSVQFNYNMSVLEFVEGKMDDYFYLTVGGWVGGSLQGTLAKAFSGSATMFIYVFRILQRGSTRIDLINTKLWDDTDSAISHTASGCTITVLTVEEWIDGEYAKLKENYDLLLADYSMQQIAYDSLNSTYDALRSEYSSYRTTHSYTDLAFNDLLSQRDYWVNEYQSLNLTHSDYRQTHSHSDSEYSDLMSRYDSSKAELDIARGLDYVLITTTTVFTATTIYYAKRKTKP